MNAFATHFALEFRMGIRNGALMLMNYLFPLGCYLLFGALMGAVNPGFLETIVPAMSIFAVMSSALLGMPDTLVSARNAGVLRSYKINGVPAISLLAIPVLGNMVHAFLVTLIIAATAPVLFGGQAPSHWAGLAAAFLVVAFAVAGLGALIGVVSSSTRMTVLLSQVIFIPSMILGGLMLPLAALPAAMTPIARLLPASYGMDVYAWLAMGGDGGTAGWAGLAILLAGGALAFALAVALFSWDPLHRPGRAHPLLALLALLPYLVGAALTGTSIY